MNETISIKEFFPECILSSYYIMSGKTSILLNNKFVLYFVFALAIVNLLNFLSDNDMISAGVFILSGILTSFFSKNMIVIFTISMVVSNIYRFGKKKEGFESMSADMDEVEIESIENNEEKEEKEEKEMDDIMEEMEEYSEDSMKESFSSSDKALELMKAMKNKKGKIGKSGKSEKTKEQFEMMEDGKVCIEREKLLGLAYAAERCRKKED